MKHIKQIFIVLLCMIIVSGCQTSKQKATNTDNEENVITLDKDTINCKTDGVVITGTTATITKAGNYTITGTLDNGQVIVDTTDDAKVTLILVNANIHSETSSAIYIKNAETTTITLKENSENHLSDASTYSSLDESGEPDATLFAKDDLVINGTGLLSIQANYKDGIVGKDDVIIEDATIKIQANDDGIQGKDSLGLKNANLAIEAVNDAIKSTNDTDAKKGTIEIHGGSYQLQTSGNDESSHKAIKAYTSLTISEGTFTIDATDDALHAQNVTIDGGQ
ncbi:hypothetical protein A4S06_02370 [Erysipelotrichaceae bacterium MTC7]|nr:hypothetical protein A4S06_02370 [Erysipelotrichaceae bacterium MTC7]